MNVSSILNQLLKQAGGQSSGQGSGNDMDIGKIVGNLTSQLAGSQGAAGGIDVKSLLGGGALGMLVGSKRGRKLGGKALKYGALAGVGYLAWNAYQNQQKGSSQASSQALAQQEGQPLEQLQGHAQEQRGLEILQAMIMAARADGHVDADERALITREIDSLGADAELHAWVERQFDAPLDAEALAGQADSPQAAREMYLVSAVIVDDQNPMERAWLDQLAKALRLPDGMAAELDRQIMASVQQR
ncbi:tellurite resistance TerB family protein [Chromatocurvus halotolerans]|uniref:Uncharacterized membrane protein YebE (DUF533 family) n=1 Tax=Chromatocurvus halotolerans TaxID=1132028 RepID=A0A4R2KQ25_9GAMM|nr:tellurite resistance TerB family protein [Chromatocurvus halotolerans]TCO72208.1 uncharacterized membrane protein YebE (DUF533 family) [Chromatocurvus halotolerans]